MERLVVWKVLLFYGNMLHMYNFLDLKAVTFVLYLIQESTNILFLDFYLVHQKSIGVSNRHLR